MSGVAIGCTLLGLLACGGGGQGEGEARPANKQVVVGVSLLTAAHPFYKDLEAGLTAAATQRGYQLEFSAGEYSVARQQDQVQAFINRKVAAIVLSPCDSKAISSAVKAANRVGIPVFTADIAMLATDAEVVSHVGSDNIEGGRLAATAVIKELGGKGAVGIIDHPEVESVIQRVRGFEEEIARHGEIKVVAKFSGGGTRDGARRAAREMLQVHPDIAAIFAINDESALGAVAALDKVAKDRRVIIVGFDALPEARQAIAAGKIFADVVQQPEEMGRQTIESVAEHLAGRSIPKVKTIACKLFTKADATAPK